MVSNVYLDFNVVNIISAFHCMWSQRHSQSYFHYILHSKSSFPLSSAIFVIFLFNCKLSVLYLRVHVVLPLQDGMRLCVNNTVTCGLLHRWSTAWCNIPHVPVTHSFHTWHQIALHLASSTISCEKSERKLSFLILFPLSDLLFDSELMKHLSWSPTVFHLT